MLGRCVASVPVPPRATENSKRRERVERLTPAELDDEERDHGAERRLTETDADAAGSVREGPTSRRKPACDRSGHDWVQRCISYAQQKPRRDQPNHRTRGRRGHQGRCKSGEKRQYAPGDGDQRHGATRSVNLAIDAAGKLKQGVREIEAAEDPTQLSTGKTELLPDARQRNGQVIAQQIIDDTQHEQQAEYSERIGTPRRLLISTPKS